MAYYLLLRSILRKTIGMSLNSCGNIKLFNKMTIVCYRKSFIMRLSLIRVRLYVIGNPKLIEGNYGLYSVFERACGLSND